MPWYIPVVHDLLIVGMAMSLEVVFTALYDLRKAKDWKLKGYTYVWMVPIYALIYPLACLIFPRFSPYPWPVRGLA
ncbi:MAG: hypothetical protein HY077_11980 [Elusimicrobia bacterium]|nr:hypothetical protein [Elusimicrobiota bacterium]